MTKSEMADWLRVSDEEFQKFFDYNKTAAYSTVTKNQCEGLAPMIAVLVTDVNGKRSIGLFQIDRDFNTYEQKREVMHMVGKTCYDNKTIPLAAAIASEAWLSIQENMENLIPASQDPKRQEVLMVQCATLWLKVNKLGRNCYWPIIRDKYMSLGEETTHEGGEFNLLAMILEPLRDVYLSNLAERN